MPFGVLGAIQNLSRDWAVDKIRLNLAYDTDFEQARKLIENDIALIVDEARIFADQVRAAIAESQKVIAQIEDVKAKLAKVGAVLDFVAAVATGSGTKIFQAAFDLRDQLNQP